VGKTVVAVQAPTHAVYATVHARVAAGAAVPTVTVAAATPQAAHPPRATLHPAIQREAAIGPPSAWGGLLAKRKVAKTTIKYPLPACIFFQLILEVQVIGMYPSASWRYLLTPVLDAKAFKYLLKVGNS